MCIYIYIEREKERYVYIYIYKLFIQCGDRLPPGALLVTARGWAVIVTAVTPMTDYYRRL